MSSNCSCLRALELCSSHVINGLEGLQVEGCCAVWAGWWSFRQTAESWSTTHWMHASRLWKRSSCRPSALNYLTKTSRRRKLGTRCNFAAAVGMPATEWVLPLRRLRDCGLAFLFWGYIVVAIQRLPLRSSNHYVLHGPADLVHAVRAQQPVL